jgi:hypothetical protein
MGGQAGACVDVHVRVRIAESTTLAKELEDEPTRVGTEARSESRVESHALKHVVRVGCDIPNADGNRQRNVPGHHRYIMGLGGGTTVRGTYQVIIDYGFGWGCNRQRDIRSP